MAVPRDPAFWKRFSMAVHMDEEKGAPEYSDSWLLRERKKKSKRTCICWTFWIIFFIFIAAIVAIIIWLLKSGVLDNVGGTGSSLDPDTAAES
ncbi:hypothetical protein KC332_g13966 [Hortaea werneckii]|uniref:Uncharacterized protein n=2 Tax=Hortaea werneckii TaxID=91943 RepID=A0A3M7HRT1_HORWE|nr:hypothetical protein KC358_g8188 [Hortaea werneckii]OTA35972.1 hypothetical protein BTJ68_05122 [Hortaea werneckii EXF-2000]KAI6830189.1 hypothetical protein KC350_g7650 [Hortaea werneckii]KAI6968367.1 hypothetical protein KC321_g8488 [Hortaea werneckii]KAI6968556.1 hypothetical protein KC329_g14087 [Hortaea werneckii]